MEKHTPNHDPTDPQNESVSRATLAGLYDTASDWLIDNVPLYTYTHDLVDGQPQTHQGLPLTRNDITERQIEISGRIICERDAQAAARLDIQPDDVFIAAHVPTMYIQGANDPEPTLVTPFCAFGIKKADPKAAQTQCNIGPPTEMTIDWRGPNYDSLTEGHAQALLSIATHLEEYRDDLRKLNEYPEDIIAYRRNKEIEEHASRIIRVMEYQAERAARDRLKAIRTRGQIGVETFARLRYSEFSGEPTRTYTLVNRQDVDKLWVAATSRFLECDVTMYAFKDDIVSRLTPAFHDMRTAAQTKVVSASVKAESSDDGPVITFIFGKEITLRNGIQRYETDSFVVLKDAYIRLLTTRDALTGKQRTAQINTETPMTRAHYDVCTGLLAWIDPVQK